MSDPKTDQTPPKKKGGLMKKLMIGVGALVLLGGGIGAGLYAAGSGMVGGHSEVDDGKPKLVPKSEQKRGGGGEGEGGEGGGHGGGEASSASHGGKSVPARGAEPYASNYYAMEKEFTSNLQESIHMIQVGVAVSTPYDDTVIENLKTNDIAVRSAILMTLGDTSEEQVFSSTGKQQLQKRLAKAINDTLEHKEGFGGISNVYFTNFVVQ